MQLAGPGVVGRPGLFHARTNWLAGCALMAAGLIATGAAPAGVDGLLYGGGADQLGKQTIGVGAVLVHSDVVSGIIGLIVDKAMGFRIDEEHEVSGIDLIVHVETAYDLHATAGARSSGSGLFGALSDGHRDEEDE